jgi:hypothetical protein
MLFLFMHTHFFIFSTLFYFSAFLLFFYYFYFIFIFLLVPAQPTWAGLDPASPARSLAQASDPAGPKPTGDTRGVSPRVHAQREGN